MTGIGNTLSTLGNFLNAGFAIKEGSEKVKLDNGTGENAMALRSAAYGSAPMIADLLKAGEPARGLAGFLSKLVGVQSTFGSAHSSVTSFREFRQAWKESSLEAVSQQADIEFERVYKETGDPMAAGNARSAKMDSLVELNRARLMDTGSTLLSDVGSTGVGMADLYFKLPVGTLAKTWAQGTMWSFDYAARNPEAVQLYNQFRD